jgi:hypothetical protein
VSMGLVQGAVADLLPAWEGSLLCWDPHEPDMTLTADSLMHNCN